MLKMVNIIISFGIICLHLLIFWQDRNLRPISLIHLKFSKYRLLFTRWQWLLNTSLNPSEWLEPVLPVPIKCGWFSWDGERLIRPAGERMACPGHAHFSSAELLSVIKYLFHLRGSLPQWMSSPSILLPKSESSEPSLILPFASSVHIGNTKPPFLNF